MTFLIVALWSIIGMVAGSVILAELGPKAPAHPLPDCSCALGIAHCVGLALGRFADKFRAGKHGVLQESPVVMKRGTR